MPAARLLMDSCRLAFAAYGIRFSSIFPGFVATEAVKDHQTPAPFQISAEKGAEHIILALRREKADYLFPWTMRWLIRLARLLPKPVLGSILKRKLLPFIGSEN